jgi:hypothetical protein
VFQIIGVGFRKHGLNALAGAPDHDYNPQLYSPAGSEWKQSSESYLTPQQNGGSNVQGLYDYLAVCISKLTSLISESISEFDNIVVKDSRFKRMLESDPTPLRRFFAYRFLEHLHSNTPKEKLYWDTPRRLGNHCALIHHAWCAVEQKECSKRKGFLQLRQGGRSFNTLSFPS